MVRAPTHVQGIQQLPLVGRSYYKSSRAKPGTQHHPSRGCETMAAAPGSVTVQCPCGEEIDIQVIVNINDDEDGRQYLDLTPDMSDMWAHSFTHDEK